MISRDPNDAVVSMTIERGLLALVDARATRLDMNRSQYFRKLARVDLGRAAIVRATPPASPARGRK